MLVSGCSGVWGDSGSRQDVEGGEVDVGGRVRIGEGFGKVLGA